MVSKTFADQLLTLVERREQSLLSWGFYDFSHTESDIRSMIEDGREDTLLRGLDELESNGVSLASALEEMVHLSLFQRVEPNTLRYRTRFAEGVRLIARLRQIFRGNDWPTAPALVSDIKLDLRHRLVPVRSWTAEACWAELVSLCTDRDLQRRIFDALASRNNGKMEFAAFQQKAFKRILSHYGRKGTSGTVVTAGTGSGKTKAFYTPAFLGMAPELRDKPFTKIIAVYPRNVLLADQLREAISEALKIDSILKQAVGRGVVFGALLGTTLWASAFEGDEPKAAEWGWRRATTGFVVPFLRSPLKPDEELIWRDEDRIHGRTCLYAATGGRQEPVVPDGMLILERNQLRQSPPDILFVSAETLNRLMGDPSWDRTLGIGQNELGPRLFLLDEVHSHEGIKGAQIAWVLRRWLHWSAVKNLHVVGLSATLRNPDAHLSRLMGVGQGNIIEYKPGVDELVPGGLEYNLVVKGDPSSGGSLLATSIQCGMLLTRLLTPRTQVRHTGRLGGQDFYGSKVFAFSDNLDSVNRWYFDIRNAELDRRLARYRLDPVERRPPEPALSRGVLASMRGEGQLWDLPKNLGFDLNQPLVITRCTSQDTGADPASDLIVATSSLEVGYDDPQVGAALHHKHPMTISSFIQRKGRAGRRPGTRPWTVTVLSDYGADRWFFQNPEQLFEPQIDHVFLPVLNPYVLRVQATYLLLDWFGREVDTGEPFRYLRGPSGDRKSRAAVLRLLTKMLSQDSTWGRFHRDFLRVFTRSYGHTELALRPEDAEGILWEQPRPLMLQVLPSLVRKLQSEWNQANPRARGKEDEGAKTPLPEFLPYATFGELGIASVLVHIDDTHNRDLNPDDAEPMPIDQALFEVCPGRVSKRFTQGRTDPGYWLAGSENLRTNTTGNEPLQINEIFPSSLLVDVVGDTPVFQPSTARLVPRPEGVKDSSNSSWRWSTKIDPIGDGFDLGVFHHTDLARVFRQPRAFLHRDGCGFRVLRHADSLIFDLFLSRGNTSHGKKTLCITEEDGTRRPVAIGFEQSVDGVKLQVDPEHLAQLPALDANGVARFRPDFFLYRLRTSEVLVQRVNQFAIERLWQTSVGMLAATALTQRCALADAVRRIPSRPDAAAKVLNKMFPAGGDDDHEVDSKLTRRIVALWRDPVVREEVEKFEKLLWEPLGTDFDDWVRRRYVLTLAEAFRATATSMVVELSGEDLSVDVVWRDNNPEIFLTEQTSGGVGQIESIVRELRSHPEALEEGMRHAVCFCARDSLTTQTALALSRSLQNDTGDLRAAFDGVRNCITFAESIDARDNLKLSLMRAGIPPTRDLVVSLGAKLLRPGASAQTDKFSHLLNIARQKYSEKLGIQVDGRVLAYLCLNREPIRRRLANMLKTISGGETPEPYQLVNALQHFLLAECRDACGECLAAPNRYGTPLMPSRSLASLWLKHSYPAISAAENGWVVHLREQLVRCAHAKVVCEQTALPRVAEELQKLLAQEIEVDYLLVPVMIAGVTQEKDRWTITLRLGDIAGV